MSRSAKEIVIAPKTILLLGTFALLFVGLWQIRNVVLVILTSVVIASFIESAAKPLRKIKIPSTLAVIIVFFAFFGMFAGVIALALPKFINELSGIVNLLPQGDSLRSLISSGGSLWNGLTDVSTANDAASLIGDQAISSNAIQSVSSFFGGLINFVLVIVISFYLAIQDRGVEKFLRIVTPLHHEEYVVDLWSRTSHKIGRWFQGQLLLALINGLLAFIGLLLLAVPYPLLLGALSGVFALVPFGVILAFIPVATIAFLAGGGQMVLGVLLMYLIIQQLENYVFQPVIIHRVTGVPALVVILSLVIGVQLFGLVGLLLAIPGAVFVLEIVSDSEAKRARSLKRKSVTSKS